MGFVDKIDTDQGVIKTTDCGVKAWGGTRMGADCFFHGTFLPFPRVLLFGEKCNPEFLLSLIILLYCSDNLEFYSGVFLQTPVLVYLPSLSFQRACPFLIPAE